MDRKLLEARLNLARHFLQHTARRLFSSEVGDGVGLNEFLLKYREDNIFQIEDYVRQRYPAYARCIECNICQPYCVMFRAIGYLEFPGPMAVAATLSRALENLDTTAGVIYNCTLCRMCETACPENAPIAEMVAFIRRYIYKYSPELVPAPLKEMCNTARKKGTIFDNQPPDSIHEKESAEYVLFLGCQSRFKQGQRVEAAVAMLKRMAVDFTTIGEVCCGAPLSAAGCDAGTHLARTNIERIREKKTAKVITLCPHCLIAFSEGKEYAGKIEPVHITEMLTQTHPANVRDDVVTYHDPCMLGRGCGIYNEPRQALTWAGAKLVEMNTARDMSSCCGNWGGLAQSAHTTAEAIAARRLEDAVATGAGVLLTECPWCLDILQSASLPAGKLRVRSVVEYLLNPEA